jgi:hypothetical protein
MQILYNCKYFVFFLSQIALLSSAAVNNNQLATKEQTDIKDEVNQPSCNNTQV